MPTSDEIVRGLDGAVARPPVPFRFRVGLLLVALLTVLLPVAYLALVAGAVVLVYLHVTNDLALLHSTGFLMVDVLLYAGPALVGAALVFSMLKPFLARSKELRSGFAIATEDAPLLFALVETVRAAVGAPAPREVCIDNEPNASAALRRGLLSFASRGDLTLTIGMPLLEGLTLRQLAGVLAHELGHFAQGSSMRLTYLIRRINQWLVRVAYGRDEWDVWLARIHRGSSWQVVIVAATARAAIWVTRRMLAAMAITGTAIGTFMLRQMELDADRYQVAVAGSASFADTALRLRVLAAARGQASMVLGQAWREGRLCDDVSAVIVGLAERMPAEVRSAIQSQQLATTAGTFDTHPPDAARIAAAQALAAPGVWRLDGEARTLLPPDSALRRRASELYYGEAGIGGHAFHPVSAFLGGHDKRIGEHEAAARYFGDVFHLFYPLGAPLRPSATAPVTLDTCLEALDAAREAAARLRTAREASAAAAPAAPPEPAALEAERIATRDRLSHALALLELEAVNAALPDADAALAEVGRLGATLQALASEAPALGQLAAAHDQLADLMAAYQRHPEARTAAQIHHGRAALHMATQKLEQRLASTPYPFDHSRQALSLSTYVVQGLPVSDGVGPEALPRAGALVKRLMALDRRCLGRLASLAEAAEAAARNDAVSLPDEAVAGA